ncbi:MAG: hypothetical protein OdinLCB4_005590 [Candidatus Odinarchaeum yellowstonii]|uniref:DNA polymerase n=1 Tax=Odinarchaeota yellowstonii (strain LCB_4) TaxID=1841599 RepID=A0AAF0IBG6_ODILC|nr:MAG: hypothetical protein OdinLCB4_005590 [Candidatus Odinarchaeum yellowstonii]
MPFKLEDFVNASVTLDNQTKMDNTGLNKGTNKPVVNAAGETPQDLGRSVLLSVNYDGSKGVAYAKLYCLEDNKIYFWYDNTQHHPYCLTDLNEEELRAIEELMKHPGLLGFKKIRKHSLLYDKDIDMIQIEAKDPLSIGGKKNSIREIPGLRTWESNIRYHHSYIMDRRLTPGSIYYIKNGVLREESYEMNNEQLAEIKYLFKEDLKIYEDLIKRYLPRIMDAIPELYRVALDIEVSTPIEDFIPEPETSEYPIIAVSLVDSRNNSRVLLLSNGQSKGVRPEGFPQEVKLEYFENEIDLIRSVFSYISEAPILVTFNGDNFDLRYLYYRAKKLGVSEDQIPIILGDYAELKKGVHIDLYPFFNNVSIKGYAFGNRYIESTLNGIAKAILNEEKVQCDKFITDLSLMELAHYCWNDSRLTMELTKFNNELVMRLIILLMRISHLPIEDLTRTAVSAWIRNLMFYEHRYKNYLIPNQEDILKEKGEVHSQSIIKGKKFKGAIVIEPVKGVHFKVVVLDFASLYPSIIKKYNLSYETVQCPDPDCKNNTLPGTDYCVCRKRIGLFSSIVGFLRDLRVNWFKVKAKDKSIVQETRDYYRVIEQALKVFINACLPADEEIIIRREDGLLEKITIGELKNRDWRKLSILSAYNTWVELGSPFFTPILDFEKKNCARLISIITEDGREIICSPNHVIPKVSGDIIQEIPACALKPGLDVLLCAPAILQEKAVNRLFIPDLLQDRIKIIVKQPVFNHLTTFVNQTQKIAFSTDGGCHPIEESFKVTEWNLISEDEKKIVREQSDKLKFKIGWRSSKWYPAYLEVNEALIKLLGYYLNIGDVKGHHIIFETHRDIILNKIISCLNNLKPSFEYEIIRVENGIKVKFKILELLIKKLCIRKDEKTIPLYLLNERNAKLILESYIEASGQDHIKVYGRRLKNDIIYILDSLGVKFTCECVGESHYIIKTIGNVIQGLESNSKPGVYTLKRVASIKPIKGKHYVYDLTTANGWFVSTNNIIVHNSYGVIGSDVFPLYTPPVADSTTAIGRYAITKVIEKAKSLGVQVLYGDTDSVFLKNPSKEQVNAIIEWSSKELGIDLDVDKIYRYVALSDRKKNYLGVYENGEVDIKGLTGKKKHVPVFLQRAFNEMIKVLSNVHSEQEFNEAKNKIREIATSLYRKIERREIPLEELAFKVQMSKPIESYTKTTPQHIKAAKLLEDRGKEVKPGGIIAFVKTRDELGVKPLAIASINDIDTEKYKEAIESTFDQVLDSLNIDFKEVMGIRKLSDFFG